MWLVFCTGIKQRTASNKYYAYGNGSSESGTCLPSHRFEAIFRRSKALDFTAVGYEVWGYGFLVDVDLSASWLLYGFGLSYDWLYNYLTKAEQQRLLNKLILQGEKCTPMPGEQR